MERAVETHSRICVIVPCYNGEKYLDRCIRSILQQTYPVEILIVNDGSTDHSLEIAKKYASQYKNIRVVTKENAGLPQARKTGVENTDCEYIGFVDADDWVEPSMYKTLLCGMKRGGRISCCNMFYSDPSGKDKAVFVDKKRNRLLSSRDGLHEMHNRKSISVSMCNKLFYRDDLVAASFPQGNFTGEDYKTILPIMLSCDKVFVSDKPLYHYWQEMDSMSRGGFRKMHYKAFNEYRKTEKSKRSGDKKLHTDIVRYLSVEYMSFIVAMSRNDAFDRRMVQYIKSFVRNNLFRILFSSMGFRYKISAILCSLNEVVLIKVYNMFYP